MEGRLTTVSRRPPPDDGKLPYIIGVLDQNTEVTSGSFIKAPFHGAILDMVHFQSFAPERRVWDIRAMILMFQPQS